MTRMLAPSLAQRFPARAPALPLARVEDPQTEWEWKAYINARVMVQPIGRGGSKDRFRPVPARLVSVHRNKGEVSLPHHKGTEWVPLECLRRWVKGEHDDTARLEAHVRHHPETPAPIPFPVASPLPPAQPEDAMSAPLHSPSHGTDKVPLAKREAERSVARGQVVIRDCLSGKYWKGGKPGTSFNAKLHGFVASVETAHMTEPASAYQAMSQARKRGINGFRHEFLTLEQASVHYGDRHPMLDATPQKEHTPEVMRPEPAPELRMIAPAPAPAPTPVIAYTPPTNPAPANGSLDTLRATINALEAAVSEKAAADSLAAQQAVELRRCEELVRVAKMRVDLGL